MGAQGPGAEAGQGLGGDLEDGAFLQGLGGIVGIGAEQQTFGRQLGSQQAHARRLVQRQIVGADARGAEQVGDDPFVDIGILAQVHRRHVEAEHLGGGDQMGQAVVGKRIPMMGDQAVAQHPQVGAEGVRTAVGPGRERGGPCGGQAGQDRMGRRQPGVDFGQGAAIGLIGAVGRGVAGGLGQGAQVVADPGQGARQAEFGPEGMHLVHVEAQHRPGLGAEGGLQHRGVDIGIAVPVAADPGADMDEGRQVRGVQPAAPVGQLGRGGQQEDPLEEGDDGVDLVLDHQAGRAHQSGRPQDHRLAPQAPGQGVGGAGQVVPVAGIQQIADGRNPVQHALAPDLGGVGGQDRRDQGPGQHGAGVLGRAVDLGQARQCALGRVGARSADRARAWRLPARSSATLASREKVAKPCARPTA